MPTSLERAQAIASNTIVMREELHAHPELSSDEYQTTRYIVDKLLSFGVEILETNLETGVIGVVRGAQPGPCIALRADIDGLPVTEATGCNFASKNPGCMHACGHDMHIAALLGAARLLACGTNEQQGTILFIFQPAEETQVGAERIIATGILEEYKPVFLFAQHNTSDVITGKALLSAGPIMAGASVFTMAVHGKGGHGAMPHLAVDPIIASSAIILALQNIISRQVPPQKAAVLTIGSIHGGIADNVIPERVDLTGTIRAFDKELLARIEDKLHSTTDLVARAHGTTAEIQIRHRLPPVVNNPRITQQLIDGPLSTVYGVENIIPMPPMMGSEDYSLLLEQIPGAILWYGARPVDVRKAVPLHNPTYLADSNALVYCVAAFVEVAQWAQRKFRVPSV